MLGGRKYTQIVKEHCLCNEIHMAQLKEACWHAHYKLSIFPPELCNNTGEIIEFFILLD